MAVTRKHGKPFISVTYLTGLLAGMSQCEFAPWFKAHFKYDKRVTGFNLEAWSQEHDALVQTLVRELQADGWKVRVEGENWVRLSGETSVLAMKPDIIAERGGQFLFADGKSGAQTKKDWFQMLLYLYAVPKAWKNPNLRVTGEVFYKSGSVVEVHPSEFTDEMKRKTFALIRRVAGEQELPHTPNVGDCKFCDISTCTQRIDETPDVATTEDF